MRRFGTQGQLRCQWRPVDRGQRRPGFEQQLVLVGRGSEDARAWRVRQGGWVVGATDRPPGRNVSQGNIVLFRVVGQLREHEARTYRLTTLLNDISGAVQNGFLETASGR